MRYLLFFLLSSCASAPQAPAPVSSVYDTRCKYWASEWCAEYGFNEWRYVVLGCQNKVVFRCMDQAAALKLLIW